MQIQVPPHKKTRLILNTDAKAEADDQYAIVHALLTPSFEVQGLISAHFGELKSPCSMEESREEIELLLRLMGLTGRIRVENGARHALSDERTPVDSAGARLIVEEAMKDDERPFVLGFCGPLTDLASDMSYLHTGVRRPIKVYETIDSRFILEDFFSKLARSARGEAGSSSGG